MKLILILTMLVSMSAQAGPWMLGEYDSALMDDIDVQEIIITHEGHSFTLVREQLPSYALDATTVVEQDMSFHTVYDTEILAITGLAPKTQIRGLLVRMKNLVLNRASFDQVSDGVTALLSEPEDALNEIEALRRMNELMPGD